MKKTPVESSNIVSYGYDLKTNILEIEFTGGNVYRYQDVPLPVWLRFQQAESKGRFFAQNIKGAYTVRKV